MTPRTGLQLDHRAGTGPAPVTVTGPAPTAAPGTPVTARSSDAGEDPGGDRPDPGAAPGPAASSTPSSSTARGAAEGTSGAPTGGRRGAPLGSVSFVGAGPGDPGLLTVRAAELLSRAEVVVVDGPVGAALAGRAVPDGVEVLDARVVREAADPAEQAPTTPSARARATTRLVTRAARAGRRVVRLLPGDAATFEGLAEELLACHRASVPFEVVPGVSPAVAVPVYAGVPVTTAGTDLVHVLDCARDGRDVAGLGAARETVVLLGSREQLAACARALLAAGRSATAAVAVTAGGTTTAQRTVTAALAELPGLLEAADDDALPGPLVAVTGPGVALRERTSWYENRPLFGWRVLVPRTQAQAGGMSALLAEAGAVAEVVPTISVEPPRTPHQVEKAVTGLVTGRYEWIGFTSVNAVRAVREKFVEYGLDARAFAGLKVAAVGGVTAGALREWGIEPDLVPSGEESAKGLLADWPAYDDVLDPINRVLLPRADIATDTLVAGLTELGWEVDDVTAYRTVRAAPPAAPVRDAIKNGAFDAVVFTSSSTVRNLVGIAGKPNPSTVVACIGPATAATATENGLRVDVLADEPSAAALVAALADHGAALAAAAAEAGEPLQRPSERRLPARRRAR
ncbi:uroporphyrinogen-III synthase [Pseudokineococcus basanitobsidens]|uniref:uroporphyrinogen-III C-methyltransferase n=1 Tax=Pseudokineococcus basanitobsidens TaxID=1926649 RepID=A0ABU8RGS5_9ACTN